jgi:hypothetical protein
MVRRCATYDIGLALEVGGTRNSDLALGNKLFTYLLGGQAILATRTTAQRWLLDHIGERRSATPGRRRHACRAPASVDRASGRARRCRRASWACGDRRFNWEVERQVFLDVVRTTLDARQAGSSRSRGRPRLQAVGTS